MTTDSRQAAPELGNQYEQDTLLRKYLERVLPAALRADLEPTLREMGSLAGGRLARLQAADRLALPMLTQWDPWGGRIDRIELTPLWREAEPLAARFGLVASGYEASHGRFARICQFALVYLFHPSSDVYTCPLAMSDGAARTLIDSGNQRLIDRAVTHLLSRDPATFWTSGQWMTELSGGSDVGSSTTLAKQDEQGIWRLYGRKWFTSAATSQIALTLARPEGNPDGGAGLALFYVEPRDERGRLNNIRVERLKDKLGTRKVPTAELTLDGTAAELVAGRDHGVRHIVPMLGLTRTWNSVCAAASMRRGLNLAVAYAEVRRAFGRQLNEQPLHVDTLAGLEAETRAAFHLCFFLVELLGRVESGACDADEHALLRAMTSIVKLTTGRQAPAVISEVVEAFGGAGYVEDTGIPLLLRDTQVLPIWEGTTNILALDTVRALGDPSAVEAIDRVIGRCLSATHDQSLRQAGQLASNAWAHAKRWLRDRSDNEATAAGARRLALTVGRALALALLVEHAQWALDDEEADMGARAAATRFAASTIDAIVDVPFSDSLALVRTVAQS